MGSVFFYTIGISFASGIFLRSFFTFGLPEIALVLLVSFVFALIWRRRDEPYRAPLFLMSLALLAFALGAFRLYLEEAEPSPLAARAGEEVTLEGVVVREPEERARMEHLYVREEETGERVLVMTDKYAEYAYGDRVRAGGTLERPESFETEFGRTFDYPGYLRARGVEVTLPFAEVEVLGHGNGNPVLAALLSFKRAFMERIEALIPEPQAGLGEGVLLGVKRALGDDLERIFRMTGIIHIVVLSGYNVMIVVEAVSRLLSYVFMPKVRMIVGVTAIAGFALLVGLGATVVRASIMASLLLIARATGRIYAILRALMLAAIVMLLLNPYLLAFDPGFQLSFLATLGLVLLAPLIEARLGLVPTVLQAREFVTATIATQIMVLPLLLYLIGEFSVVAVIVNVLVLPAVPFAMLFTFAAGIAGMLVPVLGVLMGFFAHVFLTYIIGVATAFGSLPFAAFAVPPFPLWLMALGYAFIGYVIYRANYGLDIENVQRTGRVAGDDDDDSDEQDELEDEEYDPYADWTIEESAEMRTQKPGAAEAAPGTSPFPFR